MSKELLEALEAKGRDAVEEELEALEKMKEKALEEELEEEEDDFLDEEEAKERLRLYRDWFAELERKLGREE